MKLHGMYFPRWHETHTRKYSRIIFFMFTIIIRADHFQLENGLRFGLSVTGCQMYANSFENFLCI